MPSGSMLSVRKCASICASARRKSYSSTYDTKQLLDSVRRHYGEY